MIAGSSRYWFYCECSIDWVNNRIQILEIDSKGKLKYVSQFGSELWYAVKKGLDEISWFDSQFLARNGWILFLQGFLSLFVIITVYRNRQVLKDSERWRLFAALSLAKD